MLVARPENWCTLYNAMSDPLTLFGSELQYVQHVKYLRSVVSYKLNLHYI